MGCQGVVEVRGLAVSPVVVPLCSSCKQEVQPRHGGSGASPGAAAAAADFFFPACKQQIQQPDMLWRIIENQQKARCYSSVTDISSAGRDVIHLLLFSLFFLRRSARLPREEIWATWRLQTSRPKPFNLGSHAHKPTNEHADSLYSTSVQPLVSGFKGHIDH